MDTEVATPEKSREKLPIYKQLEDMKRKGIKFTITSEYAAKEFLRNNNYYFKLKAFEKNYDLVPISDPEKLAAGITCFYSGLEFAYLQELSTLDMYLREQIIGMALSIEHFLRVRLMRDISENDAESAFSLVQKYENVNPTIKETITDKKKNSYCEQLIDNYPEALPVWVFLEVISFGDLIAFSKMYYHEYPSKEVPEWLLDSLATVRYLRNAAAHNNCLINDLHRRDNFSKNEPILTKLGRVPNISKNTRERKMGNRTIHDLVTLLYVFCAVVTSDGVRTHKLEDLKKLLDERFVIHAEYFRGNGLIQSSYEFVKKIVDYLNANNQQGDLTFRD